MLPAQHLNCAYVCMCGCTETLSDKISSHLNVSTISSHNKEIPKTNNNFQDTITTEQEPGISRVEFRWKSYLIKSLARSSTFPRFRRRLRSLCLFFFFYFLWLTYCRKRILFKCAVTPHRMMESQMSERWPYSARPIHTKIDKYLSSGTARCNNHIKFREILLLLLPLYVLHFW